MAQDEGRSSARGEERVSAWMGFSVSLLVQEPESALPSCSRFLTHLPCFHRGEVKSQTNSDVFWLMLCSVLCSKLAFLKHLELNRCFVVITDTI